MEYHSSTWLVVWNLNFLTFHSVGNVIIPTVTHSIIFQRGIYTYTTNQIPSGFSNVQRGEDPPKLDELLDFPTRTSMDQRFTGEG